MKQKKECDWEGRSDYTIVIKGDDSETHIYTCERDIEQVYFAVNVFEGDEVNSGGYMMSQIYIMPWESVTEGWMLKTYSKWLGERQSELTKFMLGELGA